MKVKTVPPEHRSVRSRGIVDAAEDPPACWTARRSFVPATLSWNSTFRQVVLGVSGSSRSLHPVPARCLIPTDSRAEPSIAGRTNMRWHKCRPRTAGVASMKESNLELIDSFLRRAVRSASARCNVNGRNRNGSNHWNKKANHKTIEQAHDTHFWVPESANTRRQEGSRH
jgi:hypothetical protein